MARPTNRLNAIQVQKACKENVTLLDGGNLYFRSRPPHGASWYFRFQVGGEDRWMGLGSFPTISLADARARAADARRLLADDIDPMKHRDRKREQVRLEAAKAVTF